MILVGTGAGCRVFSGARETIELGGRAVTALAPDRGGACLAIVDRREVWRRRADGEWARVSMSETDLEALVGVGPSIYAAGDGAALFRIEAGGGAPRRVAGFDQTPGREAWFAQGPPLHVRSLAATADGSAIVAAVHVGGIPRSVDGGTTWAPTIPIDDDVHEVRAHPSLPVFAAATAVGLCVSRDAGHTWETFAEGPPVPHSLAVAVLDDQAIFSIQDGPFASRSQIWRWRIGARGLEHVRNGLPEWLDGKVDTAHLAAGHGIAALVDGGGTLWRSRSGSEGWEAVAKGLPWACVIVLRPPISS